MPVVVHCHSHLPICPIWACPWAKEIATNWVQTLRNTYLWKCWMDLAHLWFYGLVETYSCALLYLFAHLPHMGLLMCQKLVKSGSTWARLCRTHISETAAWIYTIWSSMELSRHLVVQHHGHLKVKFWKCFISGMGGLIDMERKVCESIGCYTHFVTFNFDLNHDLDHRFSRSNFEKVVSQEWDGQLTWNERDVSR